MHLVIYICRLLPVHDAVSMILSHHHFTVDIKKIINLLVFLYDFICSFIKYHVCSAGLVQVRVGHVYIEANQYTNFLAKMDYYIMENFVVFDFSW